MSIILGSILVLLLFIFSVAAYGLSSYHDHNIKSLWSKGWVLASTHCLSRLAFC